MMSKNYSQVIEQIDKLNNEDPVKIETDSGSISSEVLYSQRMTKELEAFKTDFSEELAIAVRAQHICRWQSKRTDYPAGKEGYLKWRFDLQKFHAEKVLTVLEQFDYNDVFKKNVSDIIQKKNLKKNPDTQTLEDVACLVFLKYYFTDFIAKFTEEKNIDIIQKTWRKMSEDGHSSALKISFPDDQAQLVQKALAE